MGFFGGVSKGLKDINDDRERRRASSMDELVKAAQLAESGYTVTPVGGRRLFGDQQFGLVQNPNIVSEKRLQREKLDLENKKLKKQLGFGGAQIADSSKMRVKEYDEFGQPKSYEPVGKLTQGQELQKTKDTQEIFDLVETNTVRREGAKKAKSSLQNIPTGLLGKIKVGLMKQFDANNPILSDWQNVKSVLTEAQLDYVNKTKGAVSDKEMMKFGEAVANDDLASVARMAPQIDKLIRHMDAQERAKFGGYQKNYGEDPRQWFGQSQNHIGQVITGPDGKQYRIVGGDPNDPEVEPV